MTECTHCEHYHELVKRIDDLEKRLSYYENAHSPPSRDSIYWREQKKERRKDNPSKPGQKPGHAGTTHNLRPASTIRHTTSRCHKCGSTNITETTHDSRTIAEIPEPQPYTVTQHIIQSYICNDCGKTTTADAYIPQKGSLGCNLVAAITSLWSARLPLKKISKIIESFYNLKLSAACINSALCNASDAVEPLVNQIRDGICTSQTVYFDETSYPINGDTGWVWVATNQSSCFVTVEDSRGACILQKHFDTFSGVAVTDGWYAYGRFHVRQRCWAHILREARHLAERIKSDNAVRLHDILQKLFSDAKSGFGGSTAPDCLLHEQMAQRLGAIISRYETDWQLCKFVTKLKNARESLFTFLLYPGVEPTNNTAERALRESVIHRKIRGLVRNEKGARMFGNLMTCIMTWNMRGCNILDEVVKYL
ncbi:MAG: IS66 family transposase [Nitrosotalea sp.]